MEKEKISIKDYQEIDFNKDYINNSLKELNILKVNIINIINESNNLERQMEKYFDAINSCFSSLKKEIESCIYWFSDTTSFNDKKSKNVKIHKNFRENIYKKFKICNISIKKIKENINFDRLNKLNQNLNKIIEDSQNLNFYPSKCCNFDSRNSYLKLTLSGIETSESEDNPYDYNAIINERNSTEIIPGFLDNENENNTLLNIGQEIEDIQKSNKNQSIKIELNKENEYKGDDEEINNDNNNNILNCSDCLINKAIYKCSHCNKYYCEGCSDTILKHYGLQNHKLEKIPYNQFDQETSKKLFLNNFIEFIKYYIFKINDLLNLELINFDFPSIENIPNLESQKEYLDKIYKIWLNNKNDNYDNDDENYKKINGDLINSLERLFPNKKLHISRSLYDIDDEFFSDEKYDIRDEEFDKIKNNILFFISVVSKQRINIDKNILGTITDRISSSLNIQKNNIIILLNDNVNNYVKSMKFAELSYNQILYENPILNKLKEVKLLTDNLLLNECKIPKNYFDSKGNCLNPNLSCNLIRGTEIYDPPYGWIGIGLNVEGKYDNGNDDWLNNNTNLSEWAIAYHGISSKISSDSIKKLLKYIITKNGIKIAISKMKSNSNDERHWGKVGEGIYLSPKIKTAEHYTGTISFNNKRYKVLLMAKVYIKGIREPEFSNFWVLDSKFIRIYRVLFKEIS